jgi:hypothetical protein
VNPVDTLERARIASLRGEWKDAYDAFTSADVTTTLEPEDLDHLARAAYLIGDDVCSAHSLTRAHAAYLSRGDALSAARSALWLAFVIMDQPSQRAQAGGWLARAQRLLDGVKDPCVEQGWLLCATARQRASAGEFATVGATFAEAAAIGERFGDRDLLTLARHGQGRALMMMKDKAAGLALLDEAMVAVTSGEIGPIVAGAVYCSVITACHDIFDMRRAQEWTTAFQAWFDAARCRTVSRILPDSSVRADASAWLVGSRDR